MTIISGIRSTRSSTWTPWAPRRQPFLEPRALHADDPDKEYDRYFLDGPIAAEIDLVAARAWAGGRIPL